jgi:formylglycine-generating enzyme
MFAAARRAETSFVWLAVALLASACGQAKPVARPASAPPSACANATASASDSGIDTPCADLGAAGAPLASASVDRAEALAATSGADGGSGETSSAETSSEDACPPDMKLVDTNYCPNMQRTCVEEEYSPQNRITICHRYAERQRCLAREEHRRFCIDEYEYPNRKGGHPTWMVSWYDAQATCASIGKRLCYESEWVSACEGPDKLPFPYGYARDNTKCNIDNSWIQPSLPEVYSKDPETRLIELSRLDQSAPSGAVEGCVSGFGVRDLTGNFDEWVTADQRANDKSEWAALKGGAWGHVRNACRPTTTSHPPDFTYYFIAFRCCREARGGDPSPPSFAGAPEVEPQDRAPVQDPAYPPGPSRVKVGREHWPRPEASPKP